MDSGASGGESSGAGRAKHIANVVERVEDGRQKAELVRRAQDTAGALASIADLRGKSAKSSMTMSARSREQPDTKARGWEQPTDGNVVRRLGATR